MPSSGLEIVGREAELAALETLLGEALPAAFVLDGEPGIGKTHFAGWANGASRSSPEGARISAGTFHPDVQGRSNVDFTAAVDPSRYPVLSVTAEPGDGNPARTGPEVLRSG